MTIQDVIAKKRDGKRHSREELQFLAQAAAGKQEAADYQLSAWLMAAYIHGLDQEETLGLTLAMAESGRRLNLSSLPRPWLDKHSTGGVGDKTTLVVLPVLAACGITTVKMSGRGLGITGGTIDKLESIPGFRTDLSIEELIAQAARIGFAITGQSADLAPADKTLYALRDTTATVGSMPLIVASILSKKIAAGADHLVLDVKCGSGAFMPDLESARKLAANLKETAESAGMKTSIAITDMSQPLGRTVGNGIEVLEADAVLRGEEGRFADLCCSLAGEALTLTGISASAQAGYGRAREAIESGRALKCWRDFVLAQGGPDIESTPLDTVIPIASMVEVMWEGTGGWVQEVNARKVGESVSAMGGGRRFKGDQIDHSVGIEVLVEVGDAITPGQPVFRVYGRNDSLASLNAALIVSLTEIPSIRPVIERLA